MCVAPEGLLVLLGAGASLPGMLTTAQVTTQLVQWQGFREPPPLPHTGAYAAAPLLPLLAAPDARPSFFAVLAAKVGAGVRHPANINFEHLIHAVELLALLMPLPPQPATVDQFRFLLSPFLDVKPPEVAWNIAGHHYWAAAQMACYEILDWFEAACNGVSNAAHPQARGLRAMGHDDFLRVFSLNYDDIPYESGLDLYTGFDADGKFTPDYPWPAWRDTLCQLHGSVRLGSSGSEVAWFADRAAARVSRQARNGGQVFQDGHHGGGAPMITGLRKADKTLMRPFGTYMHVFREELLRCNRWLIVGYGFADVHINEALYQARANWRLRGSPVRAVVVDYHAPLQDNAGDPILDAWFGTPASDVFQRLCSSVFREDWGAFVARPLPKLDPSLFTEVSEHLAVDLNGTTTAMTANLKRIVTFLNRDTGPLRVAARKAFVRARRAVRP